MRSQIRAEMAIKIALDLFLTNFKLHENQASMSLTH